MTPVERALRRLTIVNAVIDFETGGGSRPWAAGNAEDRRRLREDHPAIYAEATRGGTLHETEMYWAAFDDLEQALREEAETSEGRLRAAGWLPVKELPSMPEGGDAGDWVPPWDRGNPWDFERAVEKMGATKV